MSSLVDFVFVLFVFILFVHDIQGSNELYKDYVLNYDEETFKREVQKTPHMVQFFAPWCGYCKRLAPTWEELAEKYNGRQKKEKVIVAKVDCTVETALCAEQDIPGYPTLKFFKPGETEGIRYKGAREFAALDAFVEKSLGLLQETSEEPKPPVPKEGLYELTDTSFESVVQSGNHFVKFYAPWCGHCQTLSPIWKDLARSYEYDPAVTISQVDCTANRATCNEFEVKAYPTLLWIVDGKVVEKYQGTRTHEDLRDFVTHMIENTDDNSDSDEEDQANKIPDDFTDSEAPVILLGGGTFDHAISQGITFVKFFAPWCGHCQRLSPTWDELARKFVNSEVVKIAKVDCTVDEALCNEHKVQGYPTLFIYRDGVKVGEYVKARDLESLHSFVMEHLPHDEL